MNTYTPPTPPPLPGQTSTCTCHTRDLRVARMYALMDAGMEFWDANRVAMTERVA